MAELSIISQLGDIKGDAPSAMIVKNSWKLIRHCGYDQPQLFHLADDPDEHRDRAADPACTSIVRELTEELSVYWNPKAELARQNVYLGRYEILRKWALTVSPPPIEEWRGNAADNYVYG